MYLKEREEEKKREAEEFNKTSEAYLARVNGLMVPPSFSPAGILSSPPISDFFFNLGLQGVACYF